MSQVYVSPDKDCIYCGSKLRLCEECGKFFYAKRSDQKKCKTRCRKRASRRNAGQKPANGQSPI